MEDPKRLRTKLRLDLNDVRSQIEELEDIISRDKSEENLLSLEQLIEYEKKLKAQYEEMTGITLDQATTLKGVKIGLKKSILPNIFGVIAGLLFGWGYYNAVLHGVEGYSPLDVLNYFLGTNGSVAGPATLTSSLKYSTSNQLIVGPLSVSFLLMLIRGILSKNRSRIIELLDSIAFIAAGGYFVYLIQLSSSSTDLVNDFENNVLIWGLVLLISGFIIFGSTIEVEGRFSMLLKLIMGILVMYSSIQFILLSIKTDLVAETLLWQWPWIITPLILVGFIAALFDLIQIRQIRKENKYYS